MDPFIPNKIGTHWKKWDALKYKGKLGRTENTEEIGTHWKYKGNAQRIGPEPKIKVMRTYQHNCSQTNLNINLVKSEG